ncbi:MAG: hypothetical protein Q7S36_03820 [Candidatus Liptonbacteria bacterium]|nr:hypothetical protein [Candidatus Liptonbacteria bacterium]
MKKFGTWLLFLIAVVGIGLVVYFIVRPSSPNVSLEFSKPDTIFLGKPFTLIISYSNPSEQVLKNAKFSLLLPSEISFLGKSPDQRGSEEALGDIGPGSINQKTIDLIALGGEQSFKRLEAKLNYKLSGAAGVPYETARTVDLSIGQPAVSLAITTPASVASGENFDVVVKYQNNTQADLKNVKLKLSYPPAFNFIKSSKDGGVNNQEWIIPVLTWGQAGELTINGNLLGEDLARPQFAVDMSTDYVGETYSLNTQRSETSISPSSLSLSAKVNSTNPNDYIAKAGETLDYELFYKNNSPIPLSNLKLSANLVGEMFNYSRLDTNAVYNSITNVLTWTQQNEDSLAVLNPGEDGIIRFKVQLKESFPIRRLGDKNFTLKLNFQLESSTVPPGVAAEKTISLSAVETKIMGQVAIKSSGYFYDASSGILNTGPYPPRANVKTQYIIHWALTNYSTDISGTTVTANVAPGVEFTGQVKSNIDSLPTFNSNTGVVTWSVGNLQATRGVISSPPEVIFQLAATPSNLDIERFIQILGETSVYATDTFTGVNLSAISQGINSLLPDDTNVSFRDRRVLP